MEGIVDPVDLNIVKLLKDAGSKGIRCEEMDVLLDLQTCDLSYRLGELKKKGLVIDFLSDKWRASEFNTDIADGDDGDDSHMNDNEKDDNTYSLAALQKDFSAPTFECAKLLNSQEQTVPKVLKKYRGLHLFNEQQVECVKLLVEWREGVSKETKISIFQVMKDQTMIMIARGLPQTTNHLNACTKGRLTPIARKCKAGIIRCVSLAIQRHPNTKPTPSSQMQHVKEFKSFNEQQAIGDGDDGGDSHMNDDEKDDNMHSLPASQKDFSAPTLECAKLLNSQEQTVPEVLKKYRGLHLFNEQQVECVKLLLEWRDGVSKEKNQRVSDVMKVPSMIMIAKGLPQTPKDFDKCTKGRLTPIARKSKADILRCVKLAIQRHPNARPTPSSQMQHEKQFKSFNEQQMECLYLLHKWRLEKMIQKRYGNPVTILDDEKIKSIAWSLPMTTQNILDICNNYLPDDAMASMAELLDCVMQAVEKYPDPQQQPQQQKTQ